MRVINGTLGECADRLSILLLKVRALQKQGAADGEGLHFVAEQAELLRYVREKFTAVPLDALKGLISLMLEVNMEIWRRIDLAHDFQMPDDKYASLSRNIVRLNDVRARRIREINQRYFPGEAGQEKV